MTHAANAGQGTITLSHVNTPPAQTWNYLRTNDVSLTVEAPSRAGDVYFALPRLFEGVECGCGEEVSAWVASRARDARYVEVRAHEVRPEPIMVTVRSGEVQDVGIMIRRDAEATVCVLADATDDAATETSAALVRIICERGSRLHLIEYQMGKAAHTHIESVGIAADAGTRIDCRQFFLGAGTCAAGLACSLNGTGARMELTCRYHASGTDVLDLNHVVRQRGRNTRSDIQESGVLDDAAKKTLRATIDLIHGAKGAVGSELESVLVLSDDVTNKTMPVILCDEDDVEGNHGATIGSPAPEQIRYLEDRGLSEAEAEALFVRALFDEALIQAPTAAVSRSVFARATEVFGPEQATELVETLGIELHEDEEA